MVFDVAGPRRLGFEGVDETEGGGLGLSDGLAGGRDGD